MPSHYDQLTEEQLSDPYVRTLLSLGFSRKAIAEMLNFGTPGSRRGTAGVFSGAGPIDLRPQLANIVGRAGGLLSGAAQGAQNLMFGGAALGQAVGQQIGEGVDAFNRATTPGSSFVPPAIVQAAVDAVDAIDPHVAISRHQQLARQQQLIDAGLLPRQGVPSNDDRRRIQLPKNRRPGSAGRGRRPAQPRNLARRMRIRRRRGPRNM